jgi:hypothetical protein
MRPYRLTVRTSDSQSGNTSSILVRVTSVRASHLCGAFTLVYFEEINSYCQGNRSEKCQWHFARKPSHGNLLP